MLLTHACAWKSHGNHLGLGGRGQAWQSAFLTCSQMLQMLLVCGPPSGSRNLDPPWWMARAGRPFSLMLVTFRLFLQLSDDLKKIFQGFWTFLLHENWILHLSPRWRKFQPGLELHNQINTHTLWTLFVCLFLRSPHSVTRLLRKSGDGSVHLRFLYRSRKSSRLLATLLARQTSRPQYPQGCHLSWWRNSAFLNHFLGEISMSRLPMKWMSFNSANHRPLLNRSLSPSLCLSS